MDISFVNMVEVGEPTRPYDFSIDEYSPIGRIFLNKEVKNFDMFFNEKLKSNDSLLNLHLRFMITAYKEFGRLRIFYETNIQRNYGEVLKEWLEREIHKLRITCSIY